MSPPMPPGEDAPRVLIVDDESGILDSLRILLKTEGFVPFTAHGGKQGLERLPEGVTAIPHGAVELAGFPGTIEVYELKGVPSVYDRMRQRDPNILVWVAVHPIFSGADRLLLTRPTILVRAFEHIVEGATAQVLHDDVRTVVVVADVVDRDSVRLSR